MSQSKKELILQSFYQMDGNMLNELLYDSQTYQDAPKGLFLRKLNEVFETFKGSGDTYLLPVKGFCNSKKCPNKECSGVSFVGNNSRKHINLVFRETATDISDIINCDHFEITDCPVDMNGLLYFDFKKEEKENFYPNIDFSKKGQQCKSAADELLHYKHIIIDKEIYSPWLEKHEQLFNSLNGKQEYYCDHHKFYWLYSDLKELQDSLVSSPIAKIAADEFYQNAQDEIAVLKWLIKYEDLGKHLTVILYKKMDIEFPETAEWFEVDDLKIKALDFYYISKFKHLFSEHYSFMLKKYSTFSQEEAQKYLNANNSFSNNVYLLSYHLKQRGIVV